MRIDNKELFFTLVRKTGTFVSISVFEYRKKWAGSRYSECRDHGTVSPRVGRSGTSRQWYCAQPSPDTVPYVLTIIAPFQAVIAQTAAEQTTCNHRNHSNKIIVLSYKLKYAMIGCSAGNQVLSILRNTRLCKAILQPRKCALLWRRRSKVTKFRLLL
jgi:hypothetical protein